ncbi:MAG TPA: TonB-dependent siderophore receptor [Trichormus sp. M33_DOE_039]|nr:TonB-dependent siderophore receptor [Trichormus sp. M33_DOE_039]
MRSVGMVKRSPIFDLRFWLMILTVVLVEPAQAETLIKLVSRVRRDEQLLTLNQREKFSTSMATLLAQESNNVEVVKVTGVKLNSSQQELEVILETTGSDKLQPVTRSEGNNFIADIPNAQLMLPSGDECRQENPASGITVLTVTNVDTNTIRLIVTGEASQPKVELFDSDQGLIFGVAITASSTQQPPEASAAQQDDPIELVVTGEQDGYRVPNVTTATKTDTPLRDIPQSIQVVPRQVLEDQQVTNLREALRNVSGVSQGVNSSTRGFFSIPLIRGFASDDDILTDGLRDPNNSSLGFNTTTIERIEVLKGPASVLYGQGTLGGVVNLVTKKPLAEPYYSVEFSAGSYNFYRGTIDLSGPLNDNKTLLYRLNASAQTTESFVDFYDAQEYVIAPTLTWLISDRTKLTLAAEYIDRPKDQGQMGLPAVGSVLPNPLGEIRRDRNFSEPFSTDNSSVFRVGYDLEHRLSDDWQLRSAFKATWFSRTRKDWILPVSLDADNRTLNRIYSEGESNYSNFNFDTYTAGNFTTGSINHQLVIGFNYFRQVNQDRYPDDGFAPSIDVFNPIYNQPIVKPGNPFEFDSSTNLYGFYIQDQVTLAENLKLVLGGRFDIVQQTSEDLLVSGSKESQQQEAFSPRVGIVYQPIKPISLYASYSRSFLPSTGRSLDGELFQPERGTQYEVGIKADLTDRLSATLAFFELTRSNVATTDPRDPDFSIQVGEQRSRGIEFDISGEILPGWNIIASYGLTDAIVTKDNDLPVGDRLNNVPQHSASLWTTYEISSGSLQGLGFGLGLFYVSDRQGTLPNTFELPSYVRTDATIFYKRERFRAALNFKNLFDVDYFDSALNRANVYPGEPFVVQGTVSFQF